MFMFNKGAKGYLQIQNQGDFNAPFFAIRRLFYLFSLFIVMGVKTVKGLKIADGKSITRGYVDVQFFV